MTNYGGNFMADSMLTATISLVEKGTLVVNDYMSDVCKQTGCDHSVYNGKYYSGFAPGPTFIAIPVYFLVYPLLELFLPDMLFENTKTELKLIILNILVTVLIASFLASLSCILVYKIISYFTENEKHKLIIVFSLAFFTLFFLYSTGFYARTLAAFFSIFSFYKLIKYKKDNGTNKDLFLSGLLSSIAISMDYPHILISFALLVYLISFLRNKKIFYFLGGAIIPIILILTYHYILFGNPFLTPEHTRANTGNYDALIKGVGGFNYPHLEKLFLYSFSLERGLFFYNPILLLSLFGLYFGIRKYKWEMLTIFLAWFLTYLFYSSSIWPWWWDGSYGPRYLLVTIPYLIIPLVFFLERVKKIVLYLFLIPSFFINLLGAMYDRTGFWTYPFDIINPVLNVYIPLLLKRGFSNYTLNIISYRIIELPILLINLLFFAEILALFFVIRLILKETKDYS